MPELRYWEIVLETWRSHAAIDLHQFYGLDTDAPGFWARPFWWLRERLAGLLDVEGSRLAHAVREEIRTQDGDDPDR